MYDLLHGLLRERSGGAVFAPYNLWHILYLVLLVGAILLSVMTVKRPETRRRITAFTVNTAFALYMADFFLMPFSYGYIDIDKLPFHVCTLMSILCFWSRHNRFLGSFRLSFALMGLIGALIYVVYPAGVADGEVSFFSYRILQTLLFHGLMVAYGVFSLAFGEVKLGGRELGRDALVTAVMLLWAIVGNSFYSGVEDGRTFNWCSAASDPFGLIPSNLAPYLTPIAVAVALLGMDLVIYLLYAAVRRMQARRAN